MLVLLDYYTALHQLMDALALQRGVRFSGEGAHRELIDWLAAERLVGERERVFLQELREARNNALYEGKASVISLSALDAHYGLLSGLV